MQFVATLTWSEDGLVVELDHDDLAPLSREEVISRIKQAAEGFLTGNDQYPLVIRRTESAEFGYTAIFTPLSFIDALRHAFPSNILEQVPFRPPTDPDSLRAHSRFLAEARG